MRDFSGSRYIYEGMQAIGLLVQVQCWRWELPYTAVDRWSIGLAD